MAAGTGFPYVLYDLLKKESSSVVMWTSTGTAFGIRDMASFRQDVLTCYFKHNKFSSFQRQLNLYGFRKVVKGRESGCYMHPSFLRDNPEKLTEVKRGVVPPCPQHYSRKIYGSGPRFMSQDDGSDSEPELVVQPRGHWDKGVGATDVATHMRLGEMHMSAAAFAAARAQIKGEGADMASGHAAAAAAAAAHHLQAAQAHMHGVPGDPRAPQGLDVRMGQQQAVSSMGGGSGGSGFSGGGGGGGGGASVSSGGGEGSRGRPGRTGLSKMFSSNRSSGSGMQQTTSSFLGGVGCQPGASSHDRTQHQQLQQQQQQQQHQHLQQQMQQHHGMHRFNNNPPLPPPSMAEQQGGVGRGPMGSGHVFMPPFSAAANASGMPMGGPGGAVGAGSRGQGEGGTSRLNQTSTVVSLSRLLEGLEQTLDSPLEEEMYTPIDKRNSFCAQMVNIAQVLEDDPSMQGMEEARNNQLSYLAQKRRSSVSELAAYLHDMLEDGESNRMIANTPGWTLPPPVSQGSGDSTSSGGRDGNGGNSGNRVTFKRTHADDFGSYGGYGMDGSAGSEGNNGSATASGWTGSNNAEEVGGGGSPRCSNPKRARGAPSLPPAPPSGSAMGRREGMEGDEQGGAGGGGGSFRRASRRMSEARPGKVAASPSVVQALTCLASGLPSDSEDSKEGLVERAVRGGGLSSSPFAVPALPQQQAGLDASKGNGGGRVGGTSASGGVKREALSSPAKKMEEMSGGAAGVDGSVKGEAEAMHQMPARRGSKAINDVLTNFSIDRALEQFKSDDGKEDDEEPQTPAGPEKGMRQRASVYVLMHAIAAVDTANDEAWEGDEDEPLDGVESTTTSTI